MRKNLNHLKWFDLCFFLLAKNKFLVGSICFIAISANLQAKPVTNLIPTRSYYLQNEITVTGIIKNSAGTLLPGVTIFLKDKPSVGTTTNLNGQYVLNVPANSILVFKYIGMRNKKLMFQDKKK